MSLEKDVIVIIPAYNPVAAMVELVDELIRKNLNKIVVVNDGSNDDCQHLFNAVQNLGAIVLRHGTNLGKGRALKTAFNYCLISDLEFKTVVTADADGQHLAEDILSVAKKSKDEKNSLTIGVRDFDRKTTPLRSWFGNTLTKHVFSYISGTTIKDTQTGLRGIPRDLLPSMLKVAGEGYEYEMNMLLEHNNLGFEICEVPISTVYLDNNSTSHFNPLIDSMKIYFLIIRFGLSSSVGSVVDFIVFSLAYSSLGVAGSMLLARSFATVVSFTLNKKIVFKYDSPGKLAFFKFTCLVAVFAFFGAIVISALRDTWGVPVLLSKLLVEVSLFFASFYIQRNFIFMKAKLNLS